MNSNIKLLVGDKFEPFAQRQDAITLSQLQSELIGKVKSLSSERQTVLVPGQGLSEAQLENLFEMHKSSPCRSQYDLSLLQNQPQRAASTHSHKHRPENTLISVPERLSDSLYEVHLMIDERCELMRDHQTGQHVQGVLLLEAARQALLAVSEAYLLPKNGSKFYFVINDIAVKYTHFAFPLAARIQCSFDNIDTRKTNRVIFSSDVNIMQCGTTATSFHFNYAAMEHTRIANREDRFANTVLNTHLAEVANRLERHHEPDNTTISLMA